MAVGTGCSHHHLCCSKLQEDKLKREAPANAGVSLSLFITLYQSCALFQISVADDLLAARDELAQSLALKQTIGKKRQVSNLLEHFIL